MTRRYPGQSHRPVFGAPLTISVKEGEVSECERIIRQSDHGYYLRHIFRLIGLSRPVFHIEDAGLWMISGRLVLKNGSDGIYATFVHSS